MPSQSSIGAERLQASAAVAQSLSQQLTSFVHPLLSGLDVLLDLRLLHTLLATWHVLLALRHRHHGLLLSELGAYLASPNHAPAGTKRLCNLLGSAKWTAHLMEGFVWQQAEQRLAA